MSNMPKKIACLVLAAGKSTRMKSATPKPLHKIAHRSMIHHVIAAAEELNPEKIVVVTGKDAHDVADAVKPHIVAVQETANGTGGAALAAREHFKGFDGDILIVFGDHPLITTDTLQRMVDIRRQFPAIGLTFSGMRPKDPARYGRMVLDEDGALSRIVEYKDANAAERAIPLCNGAIVCADGTKLFDWLAQIGNDNAQNEYYLTDLPPIARKDNRLTHVVEVDENEMLGANTRGELSRLEKLMQQRLRAKHMNNGVTLLDPDTVYFSFDTDIAQDVTIGQNVVFGEDVTIDSGAVIHPFSHIEGTHIAAGAMIGPFARLRYGTHIGEKAKIGNFVETKNAHIGRGAKANHLSYLGDVDIGDIANIGAGTIVCNYDGFFKYQSKIGEAVMIGSNTTLVSPVTVGDSAFVAAGSVVTADVENGALAIGRSRQENKAEWASGFRHRKLQEKAKKE